MTKCRVAFHARHLAEPAIRGLNRYTINLLEGLARRGVELYLYTDRPIHQNYLSRLSFGNVHVRQSASMKYFFWEQVWVYNQCIKDKIDIYHSPINYGLPMRKPCARVLTVHDAIYQLYERSIYPWYQNWSLKGIQPLIYHFLGLKLADHIITVSEYSKKDLTEKLKVRKEKISVVYEAAEKLFSDTMTEDLKISEKIKLGVNRPFFLYVGGFEKRKNLEFLLEAFATCQIAGVDIVLAGEAKEHRHRIIESASRLNIREQVKLLGRVDDDELLTLYKTSLAFIYPSLYEGFGLQLCEAMASGCPVFAARSTCLPEIVGAGGETFDLSSTTELVQLMEKCANQKDYRENLSRMALKRAQDFSWEKAARETLAIYKSLL